MKNSIVCLLLFISFAGRGQQLYHTEKNISYYNDSVTEKDSYTASQCLLDLYYPANVKNFATIIWFHGGGLTGGDKEIPVQRMNKGYAVVGVSIGFPQK